VSERPRSVRWGTAQAFGAVFLLSAGSAAADGPTTVAEIPVDQVAVRYSAPELGGSAHPRFITLRELTFFARIEALGTDGAVATDFVARYGKSAYERLVAEDLLASVEAQAQPAEALRPADIGLREATRNAAQIARMVASARGELVRRIGDEKQLQAALAADGISADEFDVRMRRRALALLYLDRNVTPLREPQEDELLRAFRGGAHPFRNEKWETARAKFIPYFVDDRFHQAANEYLQAARTRVKITTPSPELLMSASERARLGK
jgi:hypothetical protein